MQTEPEPTNGRTEPPNDFAGHAADLTGLAVPTSDGQRDHAGSASVSMTKGAPQRVETVVIGGGQAGLAMGFYLAQHDRSFLILDAGSRVGDAWRHRWDSLRLFTPAGLSDLPGMPFPAADGYFPTKDEFADYLEAYAEEFDLPVQRHEGRISHSERRSLRGGCRHAAHRGG